MFGVLIVAILLVLGFFGSQENLMGALLKIKTHLKIFLSHRFMTILFTGSMCTIPFINSHTLLCHIFFVKENGTNA